MANPFKYGGEVSGYRFYDRKDDAQKLHRRLVDGSTNVVLYAPRRYGKTSLVLKVLEQLRTDDSIPGLLFDMTKASSLERFCEEYANAVFALVGGRKEIFHKVAEWLQHLHPMVSFGGDGGVASIRFDYGERMSALSISEVLDLPEKLMHELGGRPLVVAFDEFQEVAEMSKEFPLENIFRSCIQSHRNVRYVFLGSKTHLLKRMFGDHARPFYKSALPMPLGKPPESESVEFIVARFREEGLEIAAEDAEEIVRASENIPYYLQALSSLTYENVSEARRSRVEPTDIAAAADELVGLNAGLYEEQMRNFSDAKCALVRALAEEPASAFDEDYRTRHALPTYSTLHSALKDLIDDGTVESDDAGYRLGDPMLSRYVRQSPVRIFMAQEVLHGN